MTKFRDALLIAVFLALSLATLDTLAGSGYTVSGPSGALSDLESGTTPVTGGTDNALCRKNAAGNLSCDSRLTDTGSGAITSTAALELPAGSTSDPAIRRSGVSGMGIFFGSTSIAFSQASILKMLLAGGDLRLSLGSNMQAGWSSTTTASTTIDTGLARSLPAEVKVTNGSTGYGTLDALALKMSGTKVVGQQGAAVTNPSGGTVTDVQARAAIVSILNELRSHGLIAE